MIPHNLYVSFFIILYMKCKGDSAIEGLMSKEKIYNLGFFFFSLPVVFPTFLKLRVGTRRPG